MRFTFGGADVCGKPNIARTRDKIDTKPDKKTKSTRNESKTSEAGETRKSGKMPKDIAGGFRSSLDFANYTSPVV